MKSTYNLQTGFFNGNFPDNELPNGCGFSETNYQMQFVKGLWNGTEWVEGASLEEINAPLVIKYEESIIEKYKYLNYRALSSSMGKYGDFEYLQYQKLEYDNKYRVAIGDMVSPPITDTINKERLRDYPEGTIDPILLSYEITPTDTELGKMYQLIMLRYEYAKNLYDIFLGFATDFRTKCRTLVELREWGKLDQAFNMVDSLPDQITLEQIQNTYADFDAL